MPYTDITLALSEYKEKYWVSAYGEDFLLSGDLKKDNYQKVTIEAKYEGQGVLVRQWWEHKGHHQRTINQYLFRNGKVYHLPHMTAIGFYTEKQSNMENTLTFEQKLALLHSADIYAHGEVPGKHKDLYRTSRFDTDCIPEHGCGYHEEGSDAERNPTLL